MNSEQTFQTNRVDDQIRFRTYLAYLDAINSVVSAEYDQGLAAGLWHATSSIQGGKKHSIKEIKRSLFLAWNTETIACSFYLTSPEVVRINNHWKPVQVYYSIFSLGCALVHALNGTKKPSHIGVWKTLTALVTKYQVPPWSFLYDGATGKGRKSLAMKNFPSGTVPVHQLKKGVPPQNILARCLRAEHLNRIDEQFPKQKSASKKARKKDKDLPPLYKFQVNPGPTTLFHLAYRLRLKANYDAADMFHADVRDSEVTDFDNRLSDFCGLTLAVLEVFLIRKIGKAPFTKIAQEFVEVVQHNQSLARRLQAYERL